MKKVVLSVLVAGALVATSCKKGEKAADKVTEAVEKTEETVKEAAKETKEVVTEAVAAVESAIEGVTIPKFEDPKVGEHLKAYSEYAKKYIDAGTEAYKNAELVKTGEELLAKGKEIVAGLDEESKKKFESVMTAIQSKMAPAK